MAAKKVDQELNLVMSTFFNHLVKTSSINLIQISRKNQTLNYSQGQCSGRFISKKWNFLFEVSSPIN